MINFDYAVNRSKKRRTVSISVKTDNSVKISVPLKMAEKDIHKILTEKSSWIKKKIAFNQEYREHYQPKQFVSGESFLFQGKEYQLQITTDQKNISLSEKTISVPISYKENQSQEDLIKKKLTHWYKKQAEIFLNKRMNFYCKELKHNPTKIVIKTYKSRWGTCYTDGRISLNWKLIMAPIHIMDYVIVHELCHLTHHNHSKKFWNLVAHYMPDYHEMKFWLQTKGCTLEL